MAYLGNTLINGSLRCLNKAYFNDLSIGNDVEIAGKTTTNQLVVNSGVNPSNLATTNSSTGNIPLIIGNPTGRHIAIDGDEIQNKSSATAYSSLYINYGGGIVCLSTGQKITANNGVFKAESLGASDSRIPNAYITTLDATTGNMEVVNASDVIADNVTVNSVLKSSKWDISNVANLANDFMVAPTIKISSEGEVTVSNLSTTDTTSKTCRLTFSDSSQINSDEFAGCRWYAGSKVRVTFTVNGTLNSNILGTIVNNMNTTAGTLVVDVTLDNRTNITNDTYEADDSTIMLYEISNSGILSPVGIRMTAYGTNNSSYIDMYGGTTDYSYTQPVFRIGNLGGIAYNGSTLPAQWGVYTYNGYFNGSIVANSGLIGGFTIDNDRLYTGTLNETDGVLVTSGVTNNFNIGDSGTNSHTWAFTAKDAFGVTTDGTVYANDVNIGGTIKATSLYVGDYDGKVKDYLEYALDNASNAYRLNLKTDWLSFNSETDTVIVGDMTGKNLSITDDAIHINNGSTPIASFGANQITLGIGENDIRNVITNTKISFQTDSGDLAYFGLNDDDIWEMHIGMTYADEMIRFGNYAWITRDNGNMTIKWLGE